MAIRERTKERNDARFFAMDTLRMVTDFVLATNPQTYLGKEAKEAIGEAAQQKMRDWVDKAGELLEKTWELPSLLVDDAIKVLTEAISAEPPTTPEIK